MRSSPSRGRGRNDARASWSGGEDQLPLILPTSLFSQSEGEEDEKDNYLVGFVGSSGELPAPQSPFYNAALHVMVGTCCIFPFCFFYPLASYMGASSSLMLLVQLAGLCACYFAGRGVGGTVALFVLPARSPKFIYITTTIAFVIKFLICLFYSATPDPVEVSHWLRDALPLVATIGIMDGEILLVTSQAVSSPELQEDDDPHFDSTNLSLVIRFLRGDDARTDQSSFSVQLAQNVAAFLAGLIGYICVVALPDGSQVTIGAFRLASDTIPSIVVALLTLVVFCIYVGAKQSKSKTFWKVSSSSKLLNTASPRIRLSAVMVSIAGFLIPLLASVLVMIMLVCQIWLFQGFKADLLGAFTICIVFASAALWDIVQYKLIHPQNEIVKSIIFIVVSFLQIVVYALVLGTEVDFEITLILLLFASIMVGGIGNEFGKRNQRRFCLKSFGLAFGALLVVMVAQLGTDLSPAVIARFCGYAGVVISLILIVTIVFQLVIVVLRRHELGKFAVKNSRRQSRAFIADMLLLEAQREVNVLLELGDRLTGEDRTLIGKYTPNEAETSESFLRECLSELRMLRKRKTEEAARIN
jgi:hypothetical protein